MNAEVAPPVVGTVAELCAQLNGSDDGQPVTAKAEGRKPFLDWVREDYDHTALLRDFRANGLASFINDWVLVHE